MSDCLKHDSKKMTQTLSQVAAALGVDLVGEDRMFSQVSINTRTMEKGDLFIALKGENFDAHDYLQQAEEKGACGLVIEQCYNSVLPQIKVDNSRVALGDIASLWSSAFTLPIIAITGSCGKTTVKEMTAAILGHGFKSTDCESDGYEHVLATRGNLNNDIGVPLTLLRLNCEHKAAVIELGANHIGEIKQLVNMVQPNVALITNVHPAHIEGFGSIEGIAQAKSEIYEGLEHDGTAIINADDHFSEFWKKKCADLANTEKTELKIMTFGLDKPADISATYEQISEGMVLTISTTIGQQKVIMNQYGRHNVYNALAATAAAIASGCSLEDVKKGLESFNNVSGRLQKKKGINDCVIFDDTYNANPGSVKAGIEAIQQIDGEPVLIFGDMGELGDESETLHYQLGEDAARMGISQLFTVGTLSENTSRGFQSVMADMSDADVVTKHFSDKASLIDYVKERLQKNHVVLVKGSRTMGMETIVEALVDNNQNNKTKGTQ